MSNDSCGNTYKEARRNGEQFVYEYRTSTEGQIGREGQIEK
jgi:hypothetical protein